jgi:hypothetical protein
MGAPRTGSAWPHTSTSLPRAMPSSTLLSPTKSATKGETGRRERSSGVPICSMTPSFITATRSATASASA